jgi:hypothetical protein
MDRQGMSAEAERLEQASGDFLVALRSNDGFLRPLYDRLADALRECAAAWRGQDRIPRLGANVLVDIVPATQAAADAYPEPVRQQIYDASFELADLVAECVALD